jgi:two-component system response regulator GlrR
LLCKGNLIRLADVAFDGDSEDSHAGVDDLSLTRWSDAKELFAARYLKSVLARVGGNISLAARESGMLRQAFQRLLKRHTVDPAEFRGRKPE